MSNMEGIKATGVVRPLDELGRVVVPKELRRTYDLKEGDRVEIYKDGKMIVVTKVGTMKPGTAIGIVRTLDSLGRIVLPKELRRTLGINDGDGLEFYTTEAAIVLAKYTPGCMGCDEVGVPMTTLGGVRLCDECIEQLYTKMRVNHHHGTTARQA